MNIRTLILIITYISIAIGCSKENENSGSGGNSPNPTNSFLTDRYAHQRTIDLYQRLKTQASRGVMVGHHESTSYGVGWSNSGTMRSDVKEVTGQFPAVYGWDLSGIDIYSNTVIDGVPVAEVAQHVKWADANGGINTFCWHAYNPIDGKDSWQVNNTTVKNILPGKPGYPEFRKRVVRISQFLKNLKDNNGNPIPLLFRPWHEHTGNWFWWGTSGCTPSEFKNLWQSTVKLMRDTLQVNNLIYVYSSGSVGSEAEYLERYPGDDYVDMLGFDEYWWSNTQYIANMNRNINIIKKLGTERDKLFAITETGYESIKQNDWFSQQLYPMLTGTGLSYVLFWRNADTKHHYVPYPAHAAANDFKAFTEKSDILLLPDVQ